MHRLPIVFCYLLAIAVEAIAQPISVVAPTTPISKGSWAFVTVSGLTETELASASATIVPTDNSIMAVRMATVGTIMYAILVSPDATPGKRQFVVSLNAWRKPLDEAVSLATTSSIDAIDSKELIALQERLATKYPYRFGSAQLEVAGISPFPPPDPDDPDPPPDSTLKLPIWLIVIRDQVSADQQETLLQLRNWSDQQYSAAIKPDKLTHVEFSPTAKTSEGSLDTNVQWYVKQIPSSASLPYVFIYQSRVTPPGGKIHWQGELPEAQDLINRVKKLLP